MTPTLHMLGKTLVVAPHADDEVLGAGGTIAALARQGHAVTVAVVTTGRPPAYTPESVKKVRAETAEAHTLLGVAKTVWLDLPAAQLAETPHATVNGAVGSLVSDLRPETLLLPFPGDVHIDHQLTFLSGMVAARPHQAEFPRTVLAYETLSETNWNAPYLTPGFHPNVFVDITDTLSVKLEAMRAFQSQARAFPHERSIEALNALAMLRGATVHGPAAEAFVLLRQVFGTDRQAEQERK